MKITPEHITSLESNEIFVFGSNSAGRHGAGAAYLAKKKFGAIIGVGEGIQGQSYGICTKDKYLKVLKLSDIQVQVDRFIKFAIENPNLEFLVTQIGCGLAGYSPKDIAPLFFKHEIPDNISLPECFWRFRVQK